MSLKPSISDYRHSVKIRNHKTKKIRTAFAVYNPPAPSPSSTLPTKIPPNPLPALHAAQIARQDPTGARTALFSKTNPDSARVGDVVLVTHRRRGEPFAGVLMSIRRAGIDTAIQLRNTLMRVGVEQWFKVYNKNVAGIEIVKRRTRRARRARLTYLRKPKHDVGSLEGAVFAWKKSRNVLTTKDRTRPGANAALAAKGTKKAKK